jgi:hypothetical protein
VESSLVMRLAGANRGEGYMVRRKKGELTKGLFFE